MTTLAAALNSSATELRVDAAVANPAPYYQIDDEVIRLLQASVTYNEPVTSPNRTTDNRMWHVARGDAETTPVSHLSGATLTPIYPQVGTPALDVGGGAGTPLSFDNTIDPPTEITSLVAAGGTVVGSEATLRGKDFYAQDNDPGEVGAESVWKDTVTGEWWTRNPADDDWEARFSPNVAAVGDAGASTSANATTLGAGNADVTAIADAQGDGSASVSRTATTLGDGTASAGTNAQAFGDGAADATALVSAATAAATAGFSVTGVAGVLSLLAVSDGTVRSLTLTGLPTTDPVTADQLWNNEGVPVLSGGAITFPAAAVADVGDPGTATTEEVADVVNALLISLQNAGLLAP